MGLDTIPARAAGQTAVKSFWNIFRDTFIQAIVPRNTSGVVTDQAGGLGTSLYRWGTSYINKLVIGDPTDDISVEDASTKLQVKIGGVEAANCDANGWQRDQIETRALGTAYSNVSVSASDSGSFLTSSTSYVDVTNMSATLTTKGGPVEIKLIGNGNNANTSQLRANNNTTDTISTRIQFVRDSTVFDIYNFETDFGTAGGFHRIVIPPSGVSAHDAPSAGTYTYKLQGLATTANDSLAVTNCKFMVREL